MNCQLTPTSAIEIRPAAMMIAKTFLNGQSRDEVKGLRRERFST